MTNERTRAAGEKRGGSPPSRVWIEWSEDCLEILATHGSKREANENGCEGSVISGPYVLVKPTKRGGKS